MTTDIDAAIAKLEGLEAKATPGPWQTSSVESDGARYLFTPPRGFDGEFLNGEDASLIITLRNSALPLLRAARDQLRAAAWLPIASAPKEGRILVWLPEWRTAYVWEAESLAWAVENAFAKNKPTHWMPIPTPPAEPTR